MSRVLLFKFQRISLSRDEADKYKTALRHIGLVANKMQPKQKGQVGGGAGGACGVYDCNTRYIYICSDSGLHASLRLLRG